MTREAIGWATIWLVCITLTIAAFAAITTTYEEPVQAVGEASNGR